MSGRVHDLVTAENFAKWAEEQTRLPDGHLICGGNVFTCAVQQFLAAVGFSEALVGRELYWLHYSDHKVRTAPWVGPVSLAYDNNERSGPALAKIARENA